LYIVDQDHLKTEVLTKEMEATFKEVEEAAPIHKKEILMQDLIKSQFKEDHLFMINQILFHQFLTSLIQNLNLNLMITILIHVEFQFNLHKIVMYHNTVDLQKIETLDKMEKDFIMVLPI